MNVSMCCGRLATLSWKHRGAFTTHSALCHAPSRGLHSDAAGACAVADALRPSLAGAFPAASPSFVIDQRWIRNVAIIAHVDHGKTTLVDCLLKQGGRLKRNRHADSTDVHVTRDDGSKAGVLETQERVMDSHALEKERGITILSKVTSIEHGPYRINIVDTPGHADFGGEVERVLSMVEGVILVVDASEGPMTQTKFVLGKALGRGLMPLVVLNKIDRLATARPDEVDSELLDLFIHLGANESQMDYRIVHASAKEGWCTRDNPVPRLKAEDMLARQSWHMGPLFDAIVECIPPPRGDRGAPFSLLVNNIECNAYLGKCYLGKVETGRVRVGDRLKLIPGPEGVARGAAKATEHQEAPPLPTVIKVSRIFIRRGGMEQLTVNEAAAGDIVTLAVSGILSAPGPRINDTLGHPDLMTGLPVVKIDAPTLSMVFSVNNSPLANKDAKMAMTASILWERLKKETETNVAVSVRPCENGSGGVDAFEVFGRGELQLGILIETLRREGMELAVSPPRVIFKDTEQGTLEPIEEVVIDVEDAYSGLVIEKLAKRKGILAKMAQGGSVHAASKTRLVFHVPTRGLIGYTSEFKNDTHGSGLLHHVFHAYERHRGPLETSRKGALISMASGQATAYALHDLEPRGRLFIGPGLSVYSGMIVGECSRAGDLHVNPVKMKQATNVRAANRDENIKLCPPKELTLEECIAYVAEDEVIEVTPKCVRLRKVVSPVHRR